MSFDINKENDTLTGTWLGCFEGVSGYFGMFQGCSGVIPGYSELFQGCSGNVPGCSRGVPGFTDTPFRWPIHLLSTQFILI